MRCAFLATVLIFAVTQEAFAYRTTADVEGFDGEVAGWASANVTVGAPGASAEWVLALRGALSVWSTDCWSGPLFQTTRGGRMMDDFDPRKAVTVVGSTVDTTVLMDTAYEDGGWSQYYLFFSLSISRTVEIVIADPDNAASSSTPASVDLPAFMLEEVTAEIGPSAGVTEQPAMNAPVAYPPMPYIETRQAGMADFAVCEDTDGSVSRSRWERACTCPGVGASCAEKQRDEPGIRFDRIEDVQVVLNYRYWTPLD
ncbi:MAG: hypothetical protein ACI9KE_000469 [Polyangiales bacterium]|jgi:hypothetical protein